MELLGLIDALEAAILSSPKLLLTDKIIMDESNILGLIDKIRLVIKNGEKVIHDNVKVRKTQQESDIVEPVEILHEEVEPPVVEETPREPSAFEKASIGAEADDIIDSAKKEAQEIMGNADEYARNVLEKLHVTVLKMQRNLSRMDETIEDSKKNFVDETLD